MIGRMLNNSKSFFGINELNFSEIELERVKIISDYMKKYRNNE
jgi:hypothetical protein